jgi:phage terminase small subunit
MGNLTPKQEAFALAYVELGNAAAAYRQAYGAEKMAPQTIWSNASRLLDNSKVAARVDALRNRAVNRVLYTVEQAFAEFEEARQLAAQVNNPSAAVSAIAGKVKLLGLDQPAKSEVKVQSEDATRDADAFASRMASLAASASARAGTEQPDGGSKGSA